MKNSNHLEIEKPEFLKVFVNETGEPELKFVYENLHFAYSFTEDNVFAHYGENGNVYGSQHFSCSTDAESYLYSALLNHVTNSNDQVSTASFK